MGEVLRGISGACFTLLRTSIFHSATHNQTGPLWCWFPSGWACAHSRPLWVSPTTSPVRLGVSPAAAPTPTGAFNQRFEALFPCAGALGYSVCFAPRLSVHACGAAGSASGQTACPVRPTLRQSRSCMFIFYLLGVGLPCRLIFCQFWLFFVFKLLSFFWLCKEAQCVYLCLHLSDKYL